MERKTKQYLIVTAAGVALFAALMNFSAILRFAGRIVNLLLPVIIGGILALFLSVPMNGIEKRLKKLLAKRKKPVPDKLITAVSFAITLICVVFVLILALTLLIPELVKSFRSLIDQLEDSVPRWIAYLRGLDIGWLEEWFSGLNWDKIMESVSASIDTIASNAVGAVTATVNTVTVASFSVIIAAYMALERRMLCRHANKLVRAYLRPSLADSILNFCGLFRQTFASFLTGQCAEAVILGLLMTLAFAVFRIPYGSLVGVVTALCALIPYIGAFISCCLSVFLVLLIDPILAIRCFVVYMAVQFVENQFIYPRVVGSSVGLPPLYTLIAAMIGGKMFGIVGIIFFIPLAAVIIELVRRHAAGRLTPEPKPAVTEESPAPAPEEPEDNS